MIDGPGVLLVLLISAGISVIIGFLLQLIELN